MKQTRRCTRISILSLLALSGFTTLFILSGTLQNFDSEESEGHIEDLSRIKYRIDALTAHGIEKEEGARLRVSPILYTQGNYSSNNSVVNYNSSQDNARSDQSGNTISLSHDDQQSQISQPSPILPQKEQSEQEKVQNARPGARKVVNEKLSEMKDQLIRAKVYLKVAPPGSNSQLVRELRARVKELERAVSYPTKNGDISRRALQRMRAMEAALSKANRVYTDCPAISVKLRAMTDNAEEQVRAEKNQTTFLLQLAGRSTPKGLHCLSMRLTSDYFALQPENRLFPNQRKLHDPSLYHFAVFSDNILACAVVVNSTVSSSMEPEKIVFHVVTDSLNLPSVSMWFLLNPPGNSTIEIQSVENYEHLATKAGVSLQKQNSYDARYTSALNHLRFYLPDVFPALSKIVLLDHDVVVQRDLTSLWALNMDGKVNGAVETCNEGQPSFRQMDSLVNFSDSTVAERFDPKACTWAFGMNVFDLQEWRKQDLTAVYHNYLQLGNQKPLWKAGSLPLGWVTFYNNIVPLDRKWHVLGLGRESSMKQGEINEAAAIHYDGLLKPWLDIGLDKYKEYWWKYINLEDPSLQQCNIHL